MENCVIDMPFNTLCPTYKIIKWMNFGYLNLFTKVHATDPRWEKPVRTQYRTTHNNMRRCSHTALLLLLGIRAIMHQITGTRDCCVRFNLRVICCSNLHKIRINVGRTKLT